MAEQNESNKDLLSVLWAGADILRGKMDANEYKDYLLGIVFYKYLSDTFLTHAFDLLFDKSPESIAEAQKAYEEIYSSEDAKDLLDDIKETYHYTIPPELTFTRIAEQANSNSFQRETLQKAFNSIEQSDSIFAGLFADVDLYSTRLGNGEQKQSSTICEVVKTINEANLLGHDGDVLGDAYEYLIGQFASETGKKAGEFYTPQAVSQILTRLAIQGQEDKTGLTVYDAAMGSGSLLLNARRYSNKPDYVRFFGQELMNSTYNLARMNMFLHGVDPQNQTLRNADTLDADWPTDEETNFDMVLMNPPYSAKWSAADGFLNDSRFSDYGVLAPKSKADYAFLLHGFYHLKNTGTMAIILPHGVLFRGAAEGKIRQKLIDSGAIYAVIGLPSNLFYNTSIPTTIIVLKKEREGRDILFIDASKQFVKGKRQNYMQAENIDHIIDLYSNRKDVDKESHLATYDEIKSNDFNLNIPRYVDTSEQEEAINLDDIATDFIKTNSDIESAEESLLSQMKELTTDDESLKASLDNLIKALSGS